MIVLLNRHSWLLALLTLALIFGVWQAAPTLGFVDRKLLPPASDVLVRFVLQFGESGFYADLLATLGRVLGGFAISAAIAIPCGLLMGYSALARNMLSVTVNSLRSLPSTAVVPIAAAALGIGTRMHLLVIVLATTIPILLGAVDGVRSVDPVLIGTARTLGQSTWRIFRTVLLPAALPAIVTALRVSTAIALIVGISSEMMLSSDGLGHRIVIAQRMFQVSSVYAGILALAVLGYTLNRTFVMLERHLLRWHYRPVEGAPH